MVKNLPVMQRRPGFHPWVGTTPWRRAWQPTPVFLPGESHGQRSLAGYSPWGHTESDTTEATKQQQQWSVWMSGISEWLSWVGLAHGLSGGCRQAVSCSSSPRALGWRLLFQPQSHGYWPQSDLKERKVERKTGNAPFPGLSLFLVSLSDHVLLLLA